MRKLLLFVLIFPGVCIYAQKERKLIREGNKLYDNGKFQEAEVSYLKGLEKNPSSFDAAFNCADALYKQKKYDEAAQKFSILASSNNDKIKRSKAYYNLGNSYFMGNKLDESIDAYKSALRLDPSDADAKYNLSAALRKKKQQQNDQNKNKDNKDNKDKKDKDKKDQDKKDQDKKDQNKPNDDNKNQPNNNNSDKKEKPEPNRISKDEAKRMLESIQNDEQQLIKLLKEKDAKENKTTIEKNW